MTRLPRHDRKLRIGIAGLGFGAAVHLPVLRAMADVDVVAIAGSERSRTDRVAAAHRVGMACVGFEALMEQDLDAVTLALPPALAGPAAALALKRGLSVLAEKPLAASASEAARLAEDARDRTAMLDFEFAELVTVDALRAEVAVRGRAAVRSVQISWFTHAYAQKRQRWGWKTAAEAHGGVMTLVGTHVLHLVEALFGRVTALRARYDATATGRFAPEGAAPAEDSATVIATTEAGVPVTIILGNAAPGLSLHRWQVVCDDATLVLENTSAGFASGFVLRRHDTDGSITDLMAEPLTASADDRQAPFERLARRFVDAARAGRPARPDFADGARVQFLVERAAEAARRGTEVPA